MQALWAARQQQGLSGHACMLQALLCKPASANIMELTMELNIIKPYFPNSKQCESSTSALYIYDVVE